MTCGRVRWCDSCGVVATCVAVDCGTNTYRHNVSNNNNDNNNNNNNTCDHCKASERGCTRIDSLIDKRAERRA
jgi:hypothetical protein